MITNDMIGKTFQVHNGKRFVPVFVTEEMLGRRLGEFAPTRRAATSSASKKAKKA
jgi:small subunit ribosomal protein S19